ncbi:disease resistance protein RPV1-like [Rosa chinensis]|uniref:disease resistance protein RPV1-like n=1 Tax=Rosa chinensis TaxID=74649 RepID=UPI001AD938F2|nr:disease resistance protein RPV1-like [Rosa chinensis]
MLSDTTEGDSSSSSLTPQWKYDVFLSFRGEDTRYNFTDHLYNALLQRGINTFIDNDLARGEDISGELLKTIEDSRISVIVFSENYASSKWCLDELVKILECKESKKQLVWPIFYKVDPSDVRNQRGSFGEAIVQHEHKFKDDIEKVNRWRVALSKAADLSGSHFFDGYESKFIHEVVEEISVKVLCRTYLNVAKHPVGIQRRHQCVEELLGVGENDVRMVGIWGIGGIGKTTLAKAIYNSNADKFEGSYFMYNVREHSTMVGGLVQLQQSFLSEIMGKKTLAVANVDRGINVIKERVRNKKVLLILDDVNQLDQLNNLAGGCDWFGSGSRIIITTRDKHLLDVHQVHSIYEVEGLDFEEALELFSWNAFKRNVPLDDYMELAEHAVNNAQRLPLALTILGSHLCGRSIEKWKAALESYKRVPNKDIQGILKISYDGLDYSEKEVFLDIACFLKGTNMDYVKQILESCDLDPVIGIEVLKEKALITITKWSHGIEIIWMHDLLEELGKEIVHQESPTEPGKRSRLWFHEDIYHVLIENTGTDQVKGIMIRLPRREVICLSDKCFSNMKNLKFFINCNASLSGDVDHLPNELRFLDWPGCHLQSLPFNSNRKKLVVLNMPYSLIRQLGEGFKNMQYLKSINLRFCKYLTRVPDFSGIPSLERLKLNLCRQLVEVHPSVGVLAKLVSLSLVKCSNLENFPRRLKLRSLESIVLQGCRKLGSFSEIVGKMDNLRYMNLQGTSIKELPPSIGYLSGLEILILDTCESLTNILPCSIYELQHLRVLRLSRCSNLVEFPSRMNSGASSSAGPLPLLLSNNQSHDISDSAVSPCEQVHFNPKRDLSTLESLDLSRSNFVSLPVWISKCSNLLRLNLCCCKKLQEISELPPKIRWLSVGGCDSLEILPILSNLVEHNVLQGLQWIDLSHCHRLLDNLCYDTTKVDNAIRQNQVLSCLDFGVILPGSEVPHRFNPLRSCRSYEIKNYCDICIIIPPPLNWKNARLTLCAVIGITQNESGPGRISASSYINQLMIDEFEEYIYPSDASSTDHVWLRYISFSVYPHDDDDDDENDEEQWLPSTSLSLEPMNPRKRKHIEEDHNLVAVSNSTANVDDAPQNEKWLLLS